eukprot:XP_001701401.1 predicted protein [Chlamydomonas reinhardtii]
MSSVHVPISNCFAALFCTPTSNGGRLLHASGISARPEARASHTARSRWPCECGGGGGRFRYGVMPPVVVQCSGASSHVRGKLDESQTQTVSKNRQQVEHTGVAMCVCCWRANAEMRRTVSAGVLGLRAAIPVSVVSLCKAWRPGQSGPAPTVTFLWGCRCLLKKEIRSMGIELFASGWLGVGVEGLMVLALCVYACTWAGTRTAYFYTHCFICGSGPAVFHGCSPPAELTSREHVAQNPRVSVPPCLGTVFGFVTP